MIITKRYIEVDVLGEEAVHKGNCRKTRKMKKTASSL